MAKKRHHYVPKFYLKGFSVPQQPQKIWVYSKEGKEPYKTSITNVGLRKHFYTVQKSGDRKDSDTVEDFLEQKIEKPANPVLQKLRQQEPISANEKRMLATYLVGMLTRVPKNREFVKADIPKLVADARQSTWNHIRKEISKKPQDKDRLQSLQLETSRRFGEIERSLIEELSLPHFDERLITLIHLMNWGLFTSCPGASFVTSDNPFCYAEGEGLLNNSGKFIFPISRNIVLTGAWAPPGIKDFAINYVPLNQEDNDAFNRIVISSAKKYIYHHSKSDRLREMIQQLRVEKEEQAKHV